MLTLPIIDGARCLDRKLAGAVMGAGTGQVNVCAVFGEAAKGGSESIFRTLTY